MRVLFDVDQITANYLNLAPAGDFHMQARPPAKPGEAAWGT